MAGFISWLGGTTAAGNMVKDGTIVGYDVGTTYGVAMGPISITQVGTGGTANTTAIALVALLNASTHPYFTRVTWSAPGAGVVRGTCDTTGEHFEAVLSATSGTGTITDFVETAHANNPYDARTPANWSLNRIPIDDDDIYIGDNSVPMYWGLDFSDITPNSVRSPLSMLGKIGLKTESLATAADCSTADSTVPEYRTDSLTFDGVVEPSYIGENFGPSNVNGSNRMKFDFGDSAAIVVVLGTSPTGESGKPAVRLKGNNNATEFHIRRAPGGVGVATDRPSDVTLIGKLVISDPSSASRVTLGPGVTIYTKVEQAGGANILRSAATVPALEVNGGTITSEGDFGITTVEQNGGVFNANNINSGGDALGAVVVNGGLLDGTQSGQARTWDSVKNNGGQVKYKPDIVTVTDPHDSDKILVLSVA